MKANFSIRLDKEQKAQLQALAETVNLEPADLIRIAIDALIRHADAHEGRILLPMSFDEWFDISIKRTDLHSDLAGSSQSGRASPRVAVKGPKIIWLRDYL